MPDVNQDLENFQSYRGNKYSIASVIAALLYKLVESNLAGSGYGYGYSSTQSFTTANYSGAIAAANVAQDLAIADVNRDRITIQNLDSTDILLIGIGENAQIDRSYEIDPRGWAVIEEGEANQRISVLSAKTGLKFVAIGRLRT